MSDKRRDWDHLMHHFCWRCTFGFGVLSNEPIYNRTWSDVHVAIDALADRLDQEMKRIDNANKALGNAASLEEAIRQTLQEYDEMEDAREQAEREVERLRSELKTIGGWLTQPSA